MSRLISTPTTALSGEMTVPGDKSISHRAVMLGAIAQGSTTVHGFLAAEDCLATLRAFQQLGVASERLADGVVIHGVGKAGLTAPLQAIDCGNSGTTLRLLAGLLAAQPFDSELTGDHTLLKRPMKRISAPLEHMGARVHTRFGCPPLLIQGSMLRGMDYTIPEISAQVKSCLLLAGLYAQGETRLTESGVTRDHTERMLKAFGWPLRKEGNSWVVSADGQGVGTTLRIPGDLSSAAFFLVAAAITPGSNICINGVGINPTRAGIILLLQRMGADIQLHSVRWMGEEPIADVQVVYTPLRGIDIPASMVSLAIDEFPALFIAAACAQGETTLRGAAELRCKETDRIAAMAAGLQRLGIGVSVLEDGIVIQGGTLQGGEVESFDDHRIAMAFAVAGGVATSPVTVRNSASIATSFPDFAQTANQIKMKIQEIEDER